MSTTILFPIAIQGRRSPASKHCVRLLALMLAVLGTGRAELSAPPLPEIRFLNPDERSKPLPVAAPEGSGSERPPWVVRLENGTLRCFIGTGHAVAFDVRPGKSLLNDKDALDPATAQIATQSLLMSLNYPDPQVLRARPEFWRTHYYGAISVHKITTARTGGPALVTVVHGENNDRTWSQRWAENNKHGWWQYPNTLLPQPTEPLKDNEMMGRYFAFICLAWCPESEAGGADFLKRDLGPVLWPAGGYLDADGGQATQGVRHAYGFVNEDWFYIFYLDTTDAAIHAARAPLAKMFEPGAFQLCYQGKYDQPALPAGFDRSDLSFLKKKPGPSDAILPGRPRSFRFEVSRIKGTPYFLGVEHRHVEKGDLYEIWLHISRDLVHWSEGAAVPGSSGGYYASDLGQRPIAANADYTAHDEIDPRGFYLAARKLRARDGIYRRFMQIELVEPGAR